MLRELMCFRNCHKNQCILHLLLVLFLCIGCGENKHKENIRIRDFYLEKRNDSLYDLVIKTDSLMDVWELPYPVYQFQVGDIDNNGKKDAMVGVIKKTRFDSVVRKRLFIFKNYKGYVRPLWLGSALGQPLVDFNFHDTDEAIIRSVEREKLGTFLVAEYRWRRFGLEFVRYLGREMDSITAINMLAISKDKP